MANATAFQAEDEGSIPSICSKYPGEDWYPTRPHKPS